MTDKNQDAGIDIPIVEIGPGWTVDDIKTIDDCDDAFAYLTGAICSIENAISRMEDERDLGSKLRQTKGALRWKKAALQIVATRRGKLQRELSRKEQNTRDRELLDIIKRLFPAQFDAAIAHFIAERGRT
jgi:hypothetical protein